MHCAVCSLWYANCVNISAEFDIAGNSRGRGFSSPENVARSICFPTFPAKLVNCNYGLQLWRLQFPTFADKKWYIWVMLHGSQRITSALSQVDQSHDRDRDTIITGELNDLRFMTFPICKYNQKIDCTFLTDR